MEKDITEEWTPKKIFVCLENGFKFPVWWIGDKESYFADLKSRKGSSSRFDGKGEKVGETEDCILRLCEIGITEPVMTFKLPETQPEEFKMSISITLEIKKGKALKVPKKMMLEYKILPPICI